MMKAAHAMRRIGCLFGVWILLAATPVAAECTLKVGWEPWVPYSYQDAEGRVTGLDIDLLRAMAHQAQCELSFVEVPWGRLLEELRHGKVVQMAKGASYTSERAAYAWFSDPYRTEVMELFMPREDIGKYAFTTFDDMIDAGFTLGVGRDHYYGEAFVQAMKNPDFERLTQEVTTDIQNIKKLEIGRIDGFLSDRYVAANLLRERGPTGWIQAHPMYVNSNGVHLMFSKRAVQPEIVARFNAALEGLKESGEYDRILSAYLN